jgi:hypothetical protein
MLDFPSPATLNQVFTAPNGSAWKWDGAKWGSTGTGTGFLPLSGGTMNGDIVLKGNATANLNPVPLQQVNASLGGYLPLSGGAMTGLMTLSGNATASLNPVPLQQMNVSLGGYLPLTGGTLTGNLNTRYIVAANTIQVIPTDNSIVANAAGGYITLSGGQATNTAGTATMVVNGGSRPTYSFEYYWGAARIASLDQSGNFSAATVSTTGTHVAANSAPIYSHGAGNSCIAVVRDGTSGMGWWNPGLGAIMAWGTTDGSGNPTTTQGYVTSTGVQSPNGGNTYGAIGAVYAGFTGSQFGNSSTGTCITNGGGRTTYTHEFYNASARTCTLDGAGGFWVQGTYTNGSDIKLKKNIEPIADALAKVLRLRGVAFDRIDVEGNDLKIKHQREIGLVAQDVRSIVPEVVYEHAETDLEGKETGETTLGIAYGQLTALLVEAVKTLAARIEELEAARA